MRRLAALLLGAGALAAQVDVEPRIVSETLPAGSLMQIKVELTTPHPIIVGGSGFEFSAAFDSLEGVALFSPQGDAYGVAAIRNGRFTGSFTSPLGALGTNNDYPFLVAASKIRSGLPAGSKISLTLDSTTSLTGPGGAAYNLTGARGGVLTIGGTLAVSNIVPGGGPLSAGTVVRVLGTGFNSRTQVSVSELTVGAVTFVNSGELQFTLQQAGDMTSKRVRVKNPDTNEEVTYYSYLRATAAGASTRALLNTAHPLFPAASSALAGLSLPSVPATGFAAIALRNLGPSASTVSLQLLSSAGLPLASTSVVLPSGSQFMRTAAELFGLTPPAGAAVRITATSGVQILGLTGDDATGVLGAFPSREAPAINGPAAPTIVFPQNNASLSSTVVDFQWTGPAGATYDFRLTETTTGRPFRVTLLEGSANAVYTIPSGSYVWQLQACNATGCSAPASSSFVVQPAPVPSTPVPNLSCQVVNDSNQNRLNCMWDPVAGAHFYFLHVVQQGTGPGGGALTVAGRQVGATSVSVLVPNGEAAALVRPCTGNGCGPFGLGVQIAPTAGNPAVPLLGEPFAGSTINGGGGAPVVTFTWSRIPGDNGSNTTYRLYVQDFSRNRAALDVLTTNNSHAAYFNPGTRYDALVIATQNGGTPRQGPPNAFLTRGRTPFSSVVTEPTYGSTATRDTQGRVHVAWTPMIDAGGSTPPRKYQYYFSGPTQFSGVVTDISVDVALAAGNWIVAVRACIAGVTCTETSDAGWGPWSNLPASEGGQGSFRVQ